MEEDQFFESFLEEQGLKSDRGPPLLSRMVAQVWVERDACELITEKFEALEKSRDDYDISGMTRALKELEEAVVSREILRATGIGRKLNLMRRNTSDKDLKQRMRVLIKNWRLVIELESQLEAKSESAFGGGFKAASRTGSRAAK